MFRLLFLMLNLLVFLLTCTSSILLPPVTQHSTVIYFGIILTVNNLKIKTQNK